jgi:hypothetical protein
MITQNVSENLEKTLILTKFWALTQHICSAIIISTYIRLIFRFYPLGAIL